VPSIKWYNSAENKQSITALTGKIKQLVTNDKWSKPCLMPFTLNRKLIHLKGAFTTPWLMVNQKFRNAINH